MKSFLPLLTLICVYTRPVAQTFPVSKYLEVWATGDITQTQKAAVLFDDLSKHKDSAKYYPLVAELQKRINPDKEPRLQVRLIMYRALWDMEHNGRHPDTVRTQLKHTMEAVKMAYPLKDKQLNAELYELYGELSLRLPDIEQSLLYNLRALDLQESIGAQYFPKSAYNYFSVSRSCYLTRDYAQSIKYGLKCYGQLNRMPNVTRNNRVFVADIIGAAHFKLRNTDSALRYYHEIRKLLNDHDPQKPETVPGWTNFWKGLTDGYLGRIEMEKRNFSAAVPLIEHAVRASIEFNEFSNAASFLNNLASISYDTRNFKKAVQQYRQALSIADKANHQESITDAALGLSQVYRHLNQPDSSYFYFGKYQVVNDSLTALINRSRINAARARLDYENIQESLAKAEEEMHSERTIRRILMLAIILLIIIASVSWHRIKTRHTRRAALQQKKIQQVQQKEAEANIKLEQFKTRISQKNQEIEALQQQLTQNAQISPMEIFPSVLLTDDDWVNFRNDFIRAYPSFFPTLRKTIKDLTTAQERLTALIKLNFDNAQAAACLGISKDSVSRSKRRLRQSLHLPAEASLEEFVQSIK
ncbi:MAG: tetratricopeptide repeat protein [Pseudobacter sp.]|uniref:tetratricopeptide repeat protein n=1 Tax=Pseudobacter sp. TaxID=2045420 RepID=UPI003F819D8A